MSTPKTVKSLLSKLKSLGEDTYITDLKGADKLTRPEQLMLGGIIAAIQNE